MAAKADYSAQLYIHLDLQISNDHAHNLHVCKAVVCQVGTEEAPQLSLLIKLPVNDFTQHGNFECCIAAAQPLAVIAALRLLAD